MASKLLLEDETYAIRGGAIEVHKRLGNGFLEAVYQEAMEIELGFCDIPFESQKRHTIRYRDKILEKSNVSDLVCFGEVLIELKCISRIADAERPQLLNYLKATGIKVGLLINFWK
ncbi:MAG: GxxExxY protein [Planctomycetota bacterium]